MANYKNIQILVAEDNAINQLLIKTILEKEGFDIDLVENGLLAVEAYSNRNYHVILMDLMMPEMTGYEASIKIREIDIQNNSTTPIIAVSADVTKDVRQKCLDSGMNDYISKPYDARDLIAKIYEFIK
ncbi:MAG: response regulator [Flavobacteriia bacterium]|nr:response regulator [Flavobacteriia bacterium]